ncbi:Protein of unknown function [Pyronema omphalodes CBS 100304]|uniref:Uncharacterized protein n=1 Tax=Pyronema omphalodes (strain CBS 100304) TaxID=1076935 RepID=U4LCY9_PYROM|nr:Protein of unknown function [Pyronema omphalodes CBS 100304]
MIFPSFTSCLPLLLFPLAITAAPTITKRDTVRISIRPVHGNDLLFFTLNTGICNDLAEAQSLDRGRCHAYKYKGCKEELFILMPGLAFQPATGTMPDVRSWRCYT